MRGFTLIWIGQLLSLVGSGMTMFALGIWAWQQTGEVTALALITFFGFGPSILLSPVAGALVDRWDRKWAMMLSDLGAGIGSLVTWALLASGRLEIWHLYPIAVWVGASGAFQFPAYSAAISTMLPKDQFGRANGMLSVAETGSGIFAPLLAGVLINLIGFAGILLIDVVTFLFAVSMLSLVRIPPPPPTPAAERNSLWQDSLFGFRHILARPSLLGLQMIFFGINFVGSAGSVLLQPLILTRTANNTALLGLLLTVGSVGGLIGGLLLSIWGGPKRRIHGLLGGMIGEGLLGYLLIGLFTSVPFWFVGAFIAHFFIPILNGSSQAIWQAKIPPQMQGRVFAARRVFAQISGPIGIVLVGPLADRVVEPAMQNGSPLAVVFGPIFGTAPGSGMALLVALIGAATVAIATAGYLIPVIRNAETILPDAVSTPAA
jgi:MFS transporter, DHA3 family, macrolide efflux protein